MQDRLSSHIDRPELVTRHLFLARCYLRENLKEITDRILEDVATIIDAIKADLKMLGSPTMTLMRKYPKYVQRLQDTLHEARITESKVMEDASDARMEARKRDYIS